MARLPRIQANHDFIANCSGGLRPPILFRCPSSLAIIDRHYRANVNVMHKPRIIWHDIVKIRRPLECPDDRIVSALRDSNHTAFATSLDAVIRAIARYTRNHAVAVHGCSDVLRCDENIRPARCFRCEKSIASLMNRQFAGYKVRLSRQNIPVLADARDCARALELT